MVTLTALANDTGNSLPNFSIDEGNAATPQTSSPQFSENKLSLGLNGTLPNILQFISDAQTLKRYNKITSIAISNDQSGSLQANIEMEIFYKKAGAK